MPDVADAWLSGGELGDEMFDARDEAFEVLGELLALVAGERFEEALHADGPPHEHVVHRAGAERCGAGDDHPAVGGVDGAAQVTHGGVGRAPTVGSLLPPVAHHPQRLGRKVRKQHLGQSDRRGLEACGAIRRALGEVEQIEAQIAGACSVLRDVRSDLCDPSGGVWWRQGHASPSWRRAAADISRLVVPAHQWE